MSKLLVKLIDASSVLTPGQNQVTIFMDSADDLLKGKFDDGSVVPLGSSTSLNVLTTVVPTIIPEDAVIQNGDTIQVIINRLQGQIDSISVVSVDVLGTSLTTFSASNTNIQVGDTVLEALQNAQGQINAINSEIGDIHTDISDLQTADGGLQTQITNITTNFSTSVLGTLITPFTTNNTAIVNGITVLEGFRRTQGQIDSIIGGFATNVMATSIGTVTPVNTALANNVTLSVAMNRLQGQIDAINANFTLGTITPVNTALASGISVATAWNRLQGQINNIISTFSTNVLATTLGTVTPVNTALASGITVAVAWNRIQGQIDAINTLGTITPVNTALASGISISTAWNRVQGQINAITTAIAGTLNRVPYYDSTSSFGDSNMSMSGVDLVFVANCKITKASGGNSASIFFDAAALTEVVLDTSSNSVYVTNASTAHTVSVSTTVGETARLNVGIGAQILLATKSEVSGNRIILGSSAIEIRDGGTEGAGKMSFRFTAGTKNNVFEVGNDDCLDSHLKIIDGDWFGTATLSGGKVTVVNSECDANKRIFVTGQDSNAQGSLYVIKSTGSFDIWSRNSSDSGEVAWWMIDAKPK